MYANGTPLLDTQGVIGSQQFYGINTVGPYQLVYTTTTDNVIVAINGLTQTPGSGYTVINDSILFTDSVETTALVEVRFIGQGSSIGSQQFYGNGITGPYPLIESTTSNAALVTVNGLLQSPGTSYTITGNTITFSNTLDANELTDVRFLATGQAGGYALLANTITFNDGTVQSTAYHVTAVPNTSVGSLGDLQGMVAYDATNFYYCSANYDGLTAIWVRAAMNTW